MFLAILLILPLAGNTATRWASGWNILIHDSLEPVIGS